MTRDECKDDAANGEFLPRWQQVGSGAAVDGAAAVTLTVDDGFTLRVALSGQALETVASLAGQLVLHSHEAEEVAVLDLLQRSRGQLAVAQVLCERGLLEIYRAACRLRGVRAAQNSVSRIVLAAMRGDSPECARAISMFCGLIGDAAGRAALTFGSAGGVYLEGALVAQLGVLLARSPFRRRFEEAGRFPDVLRAIPTYLDRGRLQNVAAPGRLHGTRPYRVR